MGLLCLMPLIDMEDKPIIDVQYTEPTDVPPLEPVLLENIMGKLPIVSAVPTLTPRMFKESFAIDTTNNIFYFYDFTDNAWIGSAPKTKRVQSVTDAATVTPNADANDCVDITALAQAVTIAAPTGTPTNFQSLIIRFKDNATARAITWNAAFVAGGVALPSTTVVSKILTVGFLYNTANSLNKWQCVASAQEV